MEVKIGDQNKADRSCLRPATQTKKREDIFDKIFCEELSHVSLVHCVFCDLATNHRVYRLCPVHVCVNSRVISIFKCVIWLYAGYFCNC